MSARCQKTRQSRRKGRHRVGEYNFADGGHRFRLDKIGQFPGDKRSKWTADCSEGSQGNFLTVAASLSSDVRFTCMEMNYSVRVTTNGMNLTFGVAKRFNNCI
jgi:hypothetical protein